MVSMSDKAPEMWLGLRRCGCPVAACIDDGEIDKKHIEQSKREFLDEGLQVIVVPWSEWQEKWRPLFVLDCPHSQARRDDAQGHAAATAARHTPSGGRNRLLRSRESVVGKQHRRSRR
jgi:hypothetical protein